MRTFKEFVEERKATLLEPARQTVVHQAVASSLHLPKQLLQKFAASAIAVITNEGFLQDLSDRIGQPRPGESKEEFVSRCNEAASELLETKVS